MCKSGGTAGVPSASNSSGVKSPPKINETWHKHSHTTHSEELSIRVGQRLLRGAVRRHNAEGVQSFTARRCRYTDTHSEQARQRSIRESSTSQQQDSNSTHQQRVNKTRQPLWPHSTTTPTGPSRNNNKGWEGEPRRGVVWPGLLCLPRRSGAGALPEPRPKECTISRPQTPHPPRSVAVTCAQQSSGGIVQHSTTQE